MKDSRPIAIIGLGYVGLPLALHFAEAGATVIGLDVDAAKVEQLRRGDSYILHLPPARIAAMVQAGRLSASANFSSVAGCQAVIICVPTPLKGSANGPESGGDREPDLSYILNTGRALAPHLHRGLLVVLESTTYPGTTDTELRAVLENGSGLRRASILASPTRPNEKIQAIRSPAWPRYPKSSADSPPPVATARWPCTGSPSRRWCRCRTAASPRPSS